jgi:hypothetical protein
MAILNVRQYFLDTAVELTGIKSGLAVSIPRAIDFLDSDEAGGGWWRGEPGELVRVDPVEFQESFSNLLYSVGAIADRRTPAALLAEFCREHPIAVPDDAYEELRNGPPGVRESMYFQALLADHIYGHSLLPQELAGNSDFDTFLQAYKLRDILDDGMPESRDWDGLVKLSDLFESESAPDDPDNYFDQRFIDYLYAQPGDMSQIHWRQFERLAGEYLHRNGYRVEIGPGRGDGGKDLVATKEESIVGPEMIYVQCKRHSEKNEVEIDHVKALWTTVNDDRATRGVIATTSRLAPGARSYCAGRQYQLTAVEGENVKQWIRGMSRHGK